MKKIERELHGKLVIRPTKDIVQVQLEDLSLVNIEENAQIEVVLYGNNGSFKEPVSRGKVLETFLQDNEWSLYQGLECYVKQ